MPETNLFIFDNDPRTPLNNNNNNNNNHTSPPSALIQVPRTRGSLCLSPATGGPSSSFAVSDAVNKRKSWCGTPTSQLSKRYGELSHVKMRCEDFLDPYLHRQNNRRSLDTYTGCGSNSNTPSPSSLPLQIMPSSSSTTTSPSPVNNNNIINNNNPLPPPSSTSRESLLFCSNSGGSDASSELSEEGYGLICDISLMERIVLSHPIWYLPGIQRAGAFHLLQGKEEGCFLVRKSSQPHTMALSVRLPPDKGPYIEHYLVHSTKGQICLETSENYFVNMAALVAHYASCCDELPVQLQLPKSIRESKSRQQLSSLALLGQEFWSYSPPSSTVSTPEVDLVLNLNPIMGTFKQNEEKPIRPNTLNLLFRNDPSSPEPSVKTPPAPPPRWSKPTTPNNFTVTTTVTFSVNGQNEDVSEQKRMSPEGQCVSTMSSKTSSITSPHSDILSPLSEPPGGVRQSKRNKQKVSNHYQESDIVDSPSIYYRSGLGDKISDYEDLWSQNNKNQTSSDLLQHAGSYKSNSNNNLSPINNASLPRSNTCSSCRSHNGMNNNNSDDDVKHVKQGSPFYAEPADSLSPGNPPMQSFKLVNFRVKPENIDVCDDEKKEGHVVADGDFEWLKIPKNLDQYCSDDDRTTLQDLILKRFPDLKISSGLIIDKEAYRISSYDNVEEKRSPRAPLSEISELTEFSDPWTEVCDMSNPTSLTRNMKVASINKFRTSRDPLLSVSSSLKCNEQARTTTTGGGIRAYALQLAQDKSTTFAQNIDNFIACTKESKENNPQIVMRNIRQFMSGMKNYLVKHGEKGFYKEIERERSKLKPTEFLNLDVILEEVMNKLVVKPLRNHLQKLFLDYYTKTGAIRLLADNIQYASTRQEKILTQQHKLYVPSEGVLTRIAQYLQSLQNAHSPLEKLEYLLGAIAVLFNTVKTEQSTSTNVKVTNVQLGADDFLPLLVWVLVKTNFVAAEIEFEYMWGLLHQPLLSGEGGYYLTTLSSAVNFLKSFKERCEENSANQSENNSVLKVVVPDELHGSILTETLPARPHMTTKEVCKIIAHKSRITNPQDYALYRLTDGEEMMLLDNECPQDVAKEMKHTMLVYKRIDAKIAWPKQSDKDNF